MKRQSNHLLRRFLPLLIVLAVPLVSLTQAQQISETLTGQAKQTRKSISYAFVSPNQRENLTLREAIEGLNSAEELALIDETQFVACRLSAALRVRKAVGSWTDGAEHSTVMRANADEPAVRYAASRLGKFARQKAVLYFHRSRSGTARLYLLLLTRRNRDLQSISKELDANGVTYRTLVPLRDRVLVYIVDLKNDLRTKVLGASRRLHARLRFMRGAAAFVGDDNDRDKAQTIFDEEIGRYERTHALSRHCEKSADNSVSAVWGPCPRRSGGQGKLRRAQDLSLTP